MTKPIWLDPRAVLIFHDEALAVHGGASGRRDAGIWIAALRALAMRLLTAKQICVRLQPSTPMALSRTILSLTETNALAFFAAWFSLN
jgi:hypothetical protein